MNDVTCSIEQLEPRRFLSHVQLAPGDLVVTDVNAFGGNGAVFKVNPITGAQSLITNDAVFRNPYDVALDADGNILILEQGEFGTSRGIYRFDLATDCLTRISPRLGLPDYFHTPYGIAVEADGDILVVDEGVDRSTDRLIRVDPVTGAQTVLVEGAPLFQPTGVAVDDSGDIYVTSWAGFGIPNEGKIIRISQNAPHTTTVISDGGPMYNPFRLAIDAGMIFVADNLGHSVYRIDPSSGPTGNQHLISSGNNFTSGGVGSVAIEADGKLVVTSVGKVIRLDPTQGPTAAQVIVSQGGDFVIPAGVAVVPSRSSLSGLVWNDFNNNGQVDYGETGIPSVSVQLTGTTDRGQTVSRTLTTDTDGAYAFLNLRSGNYTLNESQPAGFADGLDSLGTAGGTVGPDSFGQISLAPNQDGFNYNFGERPPAGAPVQAGQSATIGFWQNRNGQNLIKSLNGGESSTTLSGWLGVSFPNMFGASASANDLSGMTNLQVAAEYQQKFKLKGMKLDAQVMATALSVYVTNVNLGGTAALQYGFQVDASGLGNATFDVGSRGAAFGVANGTTLRVIDLLLATDSLAVDGVLYGGNTQLRQLANSVFDEINNLRDAG